MLHSFDHLARAFHRFLFVIVLLTLSACTESTPRTLAKLNLRLHLSPISAEWLTEQVVSITITTGRGKRVPIVYSDWALVDKEGYYEGVISLNGAWRGPFVITLLLKNGDDSTSLKAHFSAHPEIDYLQRLLLHDSPDSPFTSEAVVNLYLQPLTFLSLSPALSWINAIGLSSQWWWSTSHLDSVDTALESREILLHSWFMMNQESTSSSSERSIHPQQQWQRLIEIMAFKDSDRAWGDTLSGELQDQYNGRQLTDTLAQLLINSSCAPYILSTWQKNRSTPHHAFAEVTKDIEQADIQTILTDTERTACESSLQERLYVERPQILSSLSSDLLSSANRRQLSLRVFSLSLVEIEDVTLKASITQSEPYDLIELQSSEQSKDFWSFGQQEFPQRSIDYTFDWRDINRPHALMKVKATTVLGDQTNIEWVIPLQAPTTAELFTLSGVINPWSEGEIVARPLLDHLSSSLISEDSSTSPIKRINTEWRGLIGDQGRVALEIKGYEGPLWLESHHPYWGVLTAISGTLIGELTSQEPQHSSKVTMGVWLSPISTFSGWMIELLVSLELLNRGEGRPINADVLALAIDVYHQFNQEQRWLSSLGIHRLLSDTRTPLSQRSIAIQTWMEKSTLALAKWGRCAQGLIASSAEEETSLSTPWQIGRPHPEEQLRTYLAQEPNLDMGALLAYALQLWTTQSLSACLAAIGSNNPLFILEQLKSLGIQKTIEGEVERGQAVVGLNVEFSLRSGIWAEHLDLSSTWRLSSSDSISLKSSAMRGIRAMGVSLNTKDDPQHALQINFNIMDHQPSHDTDSLCLWGSPLFFETSFTVLDDHHLIEHGIWLPVTSDLIGQNNDIANSFAWGWFDASAPLNSRSVLNQSYPLPCQAHIDSEPMRLDEGDYKLKLAAKLWGDDEIISRSLSLEINPHPTPVSFQLEHLTTDSEWRRFQMQSTEEDADFTTLSTHWISSIDTALPSELKLKFTADTPVRCVSSIAKETLLEPIQIGELSVNPMITSMIEDEQILSSPLILSEIIATSPYTMSQRYSKPEGGALHTESFKGHWSFETRLKLHEEGHSALYIRCENELGYSQLNQVLFTIDTESPIIISAKLMGVNEALIRDGTTQALRGVHADDIWRQIDLLSLQSNTPQWARWINHWFLCPDQCPDERLSALTLMISAEDHVWASKELRARIEGSLYTRYSDIDETERREEKVVSQEIGAFNDQGTLTWNLYELLSKNDFTGFAPSDGQDLHLSLTVSIYDPAGHTTRLPLVLNLSPITPMVTVTYHPPDTSLSRYINEGELPEVFGANLGELTIENPHTFPLDIRLYLPTSIISIDQEWRESGLNILSSRLIESCLYQDTNRFDPLLRLVEYRSSGEMSLIGRCLHLPQPPPLEQTFSLHAEQWRGDRGASTLLYQLLPGESLHLPLPSFSPLLPDNIRALILSPDIPATSLFTSPFQRRRFPETSIFQRSVTCEQCSPSFVAGNQVISLIRYEQSFEAHSRSQELYLHLRDTFDLHYESPIWSLSVSLPDEGISPFLSALPLDLNGEFSID